MRRLLLLFLLILLPAIALASAGPSSAQTCADLGGECRPVCDTSCWIIAGTSSCGGMPNVCCMLSCGGGGISGISPPSGLLFTNASTLLGDIVSRFLLFAISLAGIYFLYRLITAGYAYLTSTGDPSKIQSGTKQLTNALTGLVIVITAFFIIQILQRILGVQILFGL